MTYTRHSYLQLDAHRLNQARCIEGGGEVSSRLAPNLRRGTEQSATGVQYKAHNAGGSESITPANVERACGPTPTDSVASCSPIPDWGDFNDSVAPRHLAAGEFELVGGWAHADGGGHSRGGGVGRGGKRGKTGRHPEESSGGLVVRRGQAGGAERCGSGIHPECVDWAAAPESAGVDRVWEGGFKGSRCGNGRCGQCGTQCSGGVAGSGREWKCGVYRAGPMWAKWGTVFGFKRIFSLTFAYAEYLEKAKLNKNEKDYSEVHAVYKRFFNVLRADLVKLSAVVEVPAEESSANTNGSEGSVNLQPRKSQDELTECKKQYSNAWINYMRHKIYRDTFGKARKEEHIGWEVYEAAALTEYRCSPKDGRMVATRIFETGMKKFGHEVPFVLSHLGFLLMLNDDNTCNQDLHPTASETHLGALESDQSIRVECTANESETMAIIGNWESQLRLISCAIVVKHPEILSNQFTWRLNKISYSGSDEADGVLRAFTWFAWLLRCQGVLGKLREHRDTAGFIWWHPRAHPEHYPTMVLDQMSRMSEKSQPASLQRHGSACDLRSALKRGRGLRTTFRPSEA
ncbi:hypothetical protein FB451DRAFT_1189650 [Mycena latifolia]|nr:hypothetical protein FB451DRAFT_1189650 [Mycena latifolia]